MAVIAAQLFYPGADNAVWTRSCMPDGGWLPETSIGGTVRAGGAPTIQAWSPVITAIVVPGADVLQLFYPGPDNAVWTLWQNPDGSWSEQRLGGEISVIGGRITAIIVPGTDIVQLFYADANQQLRSLWRNPDGSWSAEQQLGVFMGRDPSAIQLPGTEILQVFYGDSIQDAVKSIWRNPDGSWSAEQNLGGGIDNISANITPAVVPGTEIVQLFLREPAAPAVDLAWRRQRVVALAQPRRVVVGRTEPR
jgi:hypothetical protein